MFEVVCQDSLVSNVSQIDKGSESLQVSWRKSVEKREGGVIGNGPLGNPIPGEVFGVIGDVLDVPEMLCIASRSLK